MEASDQELLRSFVQARSEDAFRQMVKRHLSLVFATARRILGDPQLAEEVTQSVFLLLTRKAGGIGSHQPLAGWLYHTARHQALNVSRSEGRRRQREQSAAAMQTNETSPEPEWITAELEGAMEELPAEDRDALVLRFLDNRQLRELGTELGISEEAARKRVSRALEKLRGIFGKRGIALSTGLLTSTLAAQAGAGVPSGLGATIVATALTGLTAASSTVLTATQATTTIMNLLNLKTTAAILGAAAVTGATTYLAQERVADSLRADYQTLNESYAELANDQQQAMGTVRLRDEQIAQLRRDAAEVHRLRGEVGGLKRQLTEADSLKAENLGLRQRLAVAAESQKAPEGATPSLDLSSFVARDHWHDAGLAYPESTIMTLHWAGLNRNARKVLEASSYPDNMKQQMIEYLNSPKWLAESDKVQAIRMLSKVATGTRMHVEIEEQMFDGTTLRRPVTLVWDNEGWKATATDLGVGIHLDSTRE